MKRLKDKRFKLDIEIIRKFESLADASNESAIIESLITEWVNTQSSSSADSPRVYQREYKKKTKRLHIKPNIDS